MLTPGGTVATHVRDEASANLLAVDHDGRIRSEWWGGGFWSTPPVTWESTVTTLWQHWETMFATPDSVPAMLGNVGVPGTLEIFWISPGASAPQLWTSKLLPGSTGWTPQATIPLPVP
jgi:hypothetical protein